MTPEQRKYYENSTIFLGKACLKLRLTPNIITGISLIISILTGLAFWYVQTDKHLEFFYLGVLLILLTSFTDMLDGATARAGNLATLFGGVFDHVSDRYAEFFIIFGIMMSGHLKPEWAMFSFFGMLMASYVRAKAESMGKVKNCSVGFAERKEKMAMMIIGSLLEPLLYPKGIRIVEYSIILAGVLSHITVIQRLLYTKKETEKIGKQ